MAKKSLLDTLAPRPSVADLDRLAEQIHQTPVAPAVAEKPKITASPPPAAKKTAEAVASDQHRLTIDLPRWLVEAIKNEGKKNGITVRGMILAALLEKYKP